MITTITTATPPLWARLVRPLAVRLLRRWLRAEETYLDQLRHNRVLLGDQIARRSANLGPLRIRLAWWEGA